MSDFNHPIKKSYPEYPPNRLRGREARFCGLGLPIALGGNVLSVIALKGFEILAAFSLQMVPLREKLTARSLVKFAVLNAEAIWEKV